MQTNLFYSDPDLVRIDTKVVAVRDGENLTMIAVAENIVRPAGGGEPADRVALWIDGKGVDVAESFKRDGLIWLSVTDITAAVGQPLTVSVDLEHRERRRRLHTAVHLAIRTASNLHPDFEVNDAQIDLDARRAMIDAAVDGDDRLSEIDPMFFDLIGQRRHVDAIRAKSVDDARRQFGSLFRLGGRYSLTGKVRLVRIEGFDINPCSGLHAPNTGLGSIVLKTERVGSKFSIMIGLA